LHANGYEDTERLKSEQEKATSEEVERFYQKAIEIIAHNREFLEKIAVALAEKKLLTADDVQRIKSDCKIVQVAI
jgi:ATP-dependent Zn protease